MKLHPRLIWAISCEPKGRTLPRITRFFHDQHCPTQPHSSNKTAAPTHLVREVRAVLPRHTAFPGQAPTRVHCDGDVSGKQCRRRVADLNQQFRRRVVHGNLGGVVRGLSYCVERS